MPGFNPFRNRFPYTNINDINLDWIIKKVKALSEAVASIDVSRIDEIAQQAETAQQDAETALATAQSAETTANSVQGIANNALTTAQSAETTANSVQGIANNALTTAQSAQTTATQAATDAQTANNNALSAIDIGDNAAAIAQQARSEAQSAQTTAAALNTSKADKVTGATLNNFAGLAANGNLKDSGYTSSDFAVASAGVPTGGATGQVLTKTGAADFDTAWQTPIGGGTNSNLLDNWYFIGGGSQLGFGTFPINQRGQASYSNANAYTIDRWKLTSGSIIVTSGGIVLNGTIVQILPASIGLPVVASALLSDGTMIMPSYDDTTKTFTLTATGQTIVAAKLEIGNVQTLAHQENSAWVLNEIPDYVDEIANCQQYFRIIDNGAGGGSGQYYVGVRGYSVTTEVYYMVEPTMRNVITPTTPNGIQGACIDGSGTVSNISSVTTSGTNKRIIINVQGALARTPIAMYINSIIWLSADL